MHRRTHAYVEDKICILFTLHAILFVYEMTYTIHICERACIYDQFFGHFGIIFLRGLRKKISNSKSYCQCMNNS